MRNLIFGLFIILSPAALSSTLPGFSCGGGDYCCSDLKTCDGTFFCASGVHPKAEMKLFAAACVRDFTPCDETTPCCGNCIVPPGQTTGLCQGGGK